MSNEPPYRRAYADASWTPFWLDRADRPADARRSRPSHRRPRDRRRRVHRPVGRGPGPRGHPGSRGRRARGRADRVRRQRPQRRFLRRVADPRARERPPRGSPTRSSGSSRRDGRTSTHRRDDRAPRHRLRVGADGHARVATEPHRSPWCDDAVASLTAFGHDASVLDRDAVRAEVNSPTYLAGFWKRTGSAHGRPGAACLGAGRRGRGGSAPRSTSTRWCVDRGRRRRVVVRTPARPGARTAGDPRRRTRSRRSRRSSVTTSCPSTTTC